MTHAPPHQSNGHAVAHPGTAQAYDAGVVARTRITPPPARADLVSRPHLVQRLVPGGPQKLVLLAAPAGAGKTTLLTQWIAGLPPEVLLAWLALDTSDNEPGQFLRHLVAALQRTRPGLGQMALAALLHGGQAADMPTVASLLVNDLAAVEGPVAIVLDDYHLIAASAIHDLITFVLDHAPPTLRLVLACRADPPLPLARLRARGHLAELRAADLRFTSAEVGALAQQTTGHTLTPAQIDTLHQRTEGWAAGLHLAALAMQQHSEPQQTLAAFSGQHRFVLDYVLDEVIRHLPPHLATFLGQTAMLSRLCAPLCDAVTQRSDSAHLLRDLEQAHLFLEPLDAASQWYRCPALFAEALRSQFQATHPEQVPELHQRASAWYAAHGFTDEAIQHALAGGDRSGAAALIEQSFLEPLMRADTAQVLGWLRALPAEVVAARPRLWLAAATAWIVAGQYAQADPWLTRLEHAAPDPDAAGLYETLQAHNAYYRGDLAATMAWARAALAQQPTATAAAAHERQVVIPAAAVIRSGAEVMQGQIDAALTTLRHALQQLPPAIAPEQQLGGAMLAALHMRLADLSYEINDLPAAERHAREASTLGQQSGYLAYHAHALALLGRVAQAHGKPDDAQAQMQTAVQIVQALHIVDDITYTVLGWALQLAIARQDATAVDAWQQTWADVVPSDATDQPPVLHQMGALLHARRHLFRQEPDAALELLTTLRNQAEQVGLTRLTLEILLLHALAWQARLHTRQAIATLAEALTLADRGGFVRLIADEGAPMALLLAQVRQRGAEGARASVSAAYLDRLLEVCATTAGTPAPAAARTVRSLDALSTREQEVLRLLADGLSNAEIAERLVVTPGTVKRHLHNLYSKLGVENRTQAAAFARTHAPPTTE
jgi:LuxR family maltose regulon positive regulatory protein